MRALLLALVALAIAAPAASAHATLEATTPSRGAAVKAEPAQVVFRFNEPVEGTFGAVRVFDAKGVRVATTGLSMAWRRPGLASWRVRQADSDQAIV